MAVEEPKYEVIKEELEMSLRRYAELIIAETSVEGEFKNVSNEGFRRLASYIFGGNSPQRKITMTAPVGLEKSSPTTWKVSFTMPAEHTMKTLPEPNDSRVVLREIPSRLIAAYAYTRTWSQERYEQRVLLLKEWIQSQGLKVAGEPILARYNPPWTPWFLRRNEILIPVS